jgi:hypothetical protein
MATPLLHLFSLALPLLPQIGFPSLGNFEAFTRRKGGDQYGKSKKKKKIQPKKFSQTPVCTVGILGTSERGGRKGGKEDEAR